MQCGLEIDVYRCGVQGLMSAWIKLAKVRQRNWSVGRQVSAPDMATYSTSTPVDSPTTPLHPPRRQPSSLLTCRFQTIDASKSQKRPFYIYNYSESLPVSNKILQTYLNDEIFFFGNAHKIYTSIYTIRKKCICYTK